MIRYTRKYKLIDDFILQNNKKYTNFQYSLSFETCKSIEENFKINKSCFYCNFCAFSKNNILNLNYKEKLNKLYNKYNSDNFFNGKLVKMPNSDFYANIPEQKNIEIFMSTEETKRIQLWATCILDNCTPNKTISCIELPAPNESYDRNGRIDIGIKEDDSFIFIETKTSLSDAMSDERFVEQHAKYTPSIENNIQKLSNMDVSYLLCILIGGKETDFYPQNSEYCSEKSKELSKRFYDLISANNKRIPFISVSAIWLLSMYYLSNKDFSINKFLIKLFSSDNCYGLVSAGKIIYNKEDNLFTIEPILL